MAEAGEAPAGGDGGGAPSAPAPTGNLDINTGAPAASGLGGPPPETKPAAPEAKPAPAKAAGDPAPKPAPAAKDAPAKPAAKTIADSPPSEPSEKQVVPADWPEDWRTKLAGENKKAADRLARFKSPNELANSYIALEQKLSSGEYAKKLPTHYTEQELADYRKSNGIPDTPGDYKDDLPGIVWGEADKPMLDSWKQYAHEHNVPPDEVKRGLAWFVREQENIVARLEQEDMHNYQAGTAALQAEWGKEFKGNINAAKNLLEAHPGMWETMMAARGPDGMKLGDNPAVLKAFAALAREANPYATIAPTAQNQDPAKTVDARLGEINKMMGNKNGPYWRGPDAQKIQQEYRELLELKERAGARGQRAA